MRSPSEPCPDERVILGGLHHAQRHGFFVRARRTSDMASIAIQEPSGQILGGRYSSASEYMRELIRADEKRRAEEELQAKVLEGLNSQKTALKAADWKAIRGEALARIQARGKTNR
jgi:antitoxin ParD1/3/4